MGTSNLYDRIVGQHSSLEGIMSHVPGYRGYKEATDRRASDRLVRQHIVQKLKEQFDRLVTVEKKLLAGGDISQAGLTSGAKLKFQPILIALIRRLRAIRASTMPSRLAPMNSPKSTISMPLYSTM